MKRLIANTGILILIILITIGIKPSYQSITDPSSPIMKIGSEGSDITINKVDLRVLVDNDYVPLEDLVVEGQTAEEASTFPRIVNGSTVKINATYSPLIGSSDSFVIREFAIMVFDIVNESISLKVGVSRYRFVAPEELILKPNSSKTEVITIDSISLPDFTAYKFVFRVQYHTYRGDELPVDSYYHQNMTFELIESNPEPPYFLLYIFYFATTIFIALILLGIYGDRKYKVPSS